MQTSFIRDRYVKDAIGTASPVRLLSMLYDRLVRDLVVAETALLSDGTAEANRALVHAQEVICELRSSLRPEQWDGGPALASLYAYLLTELIKANVTKDPSRVSACRSLVEPLAEAWAEVARTAGTAVPAPVLDNEVVGPGAVRATA